MASFRKRSNGWEYRIRHKDLQTGEWGEVSKGGFLTKKEAQLAAGKIEAEIEYYGFVEDGKETIANYFPRWFKLYKEPNLKDSTKEMQWRMVEKNILPRWGNYTLKQITRSEYREWLLELLERYSEGTLRRLHSIFSNALNDAALEFKIIKENPLARMRIPVKKDKPKEKIKFFTVEQMNRFLEEAKTKQKGAKYKDSNERYVMYLLMARSGLRIGEILALTWDDIDFNNNTVSVNKTVRYKDTGSIPEVTIPKTETSLRTIELDKEMMKVLRYHHLNQKQMHMVYPGSRPKDEKGNKLPLVFHNWNGKHWRAYIIREHFVSVCKRAGLPQLSPHALRHSHAVHLLEAGAEIKYISERLGHKSIATTSNVYLHVTKKIERNALDLYEKHMKM